MPSSTCHIQPTFHQAQPISNSLLQMSPSSSGLMSGIPWQITSFTDLQYSCSRRNRHRRRIHQRTHHGRRFMNNSQSKMFRPQRSSSITILTKTYVHGRNFTEIVATCKLNFTQGQGSSLIRTYIHIHTQLRVMHSNITL